MTHPTNDEKSLPWVHPGNWSDQYGGLTKRELFAAMAMQALLTADPVLKASVNKGGGDLAPTRASDAVRCADALLTALQENTGGK